MADPDRRQHERITIAMPTRMWLEEMYRGKEIVFEGYSTTLDLAIGGTFLVSNYLLPVGFPLNLEMRISDDEFLVARGEIVHSIGGEDAHEPGMGIMFTAVDAENRERLLRFFVSDRIRDFYADRFLIEFPHLESVLSLKDVALVINLWEDRDGRLTSLHKPLEGRAADERRAEHARAAGKGRRR